VVWRPPKPVVVEETTVSKPKPVSKWTVNPKAPAAPAIVEEEPKPEPPPPPPVIMGMLPFFLFSFF